MLAAPPMSHERPRWWDDLSDAELVARLVGRGWRPVEAGAVVSDRDHPDARALITEALDPTISRPYGPR
jgi:hypothetical protein